MANRFLIGNVKGKKGDQGIQGLQGIPGVSGIMSNANMVRGIGRDMMKILLGHGFEEMTTQSLINEALAETAFEIRHRMNNNDEIDGSRIPDPSGIMIGDYIDGLDLSGIAAPANGQAPVAWSDVYKNNRIIVSGLNYYKGGGDTENAKNHIVFTFADCIATGRINPTADNTGGYIASEIRQWLEGANGDGSGPFATGLKAALGGDFLYTIRKYEGNKDSPAWNNYTVFLLSEIEVYGKSIRGTDILSNGQRAVMPMIQLPIFQMSMEHIVKKLNGARYTSWLSSAYAANGHYFCYVSYNGVASNSGADIVTGLSPAFCVA